MNLTCRRRPCAAGCFLALILGFALVGEVAAAAQAASTWSSHPGYRTREIKVAVAHPRGAGFTPVPSGESGLLFTNVVSRQRYTTNQIYLNGSGVAAGDIDGDGLCDLYFAGLDSSNRMFRNLGDWRFEDVTAASGTACDHLASTSVALADLDGDGDLDLVVNSIGVGTEILLNDGRGRFTPRARLNVGRGGMSLALADTDLDGDLDLYVVNYRPSTIRDVPNARLRFNMVDNKPVVTAFEGRPVTEPDLVGRFELDPGGKVLEFGEVDRFYLNDGQGQFKAVSFTGGLMLDEAGRPLAQPPRDWGLSAMFRDINQDGWPDLYVCNDFDSPDRIWINTGTGQFRAIEPLALRHTSMFSMGVDFADLDRDGFDDVFVVDMLSQDRRRRQVQVGELMPSRHAPGRVDDRPQYMRNMLFHNRGDGTYAEIAYQAGLHATEWSWCPAFLDVDLDGYEDVLVTNGHERDAMNADVIDRGEAIKNSRKLSPQEMLELKNTFDRLNVANVAFRNRGDLTFEDMSTVWGFAVPRVSHGLALADLDNDGDLDVALNNLNDPALVLRNDAAAPRIAVRLRSRTLNTRAIGARIEVTGARVPQSQEVSCGGRYLSSDEPGRTFAAAGGDRFTIRVRWPGGRETLVSNVPPNVLCEIDDSSAVAGPPPVATPPRTRALSESAWFEDDSAKLAHTHRGDAYDDFPRQGWMPRTLALWGPAVAWFDADGDGAEDLVVGAGRNGTPGWLRSDGQGGFRAAQPTASSPREWTGLTGLVVAGSGPRLLAGSSNYEDASSTAPAVVSFMTASNLVQTVVEGGLDSTGPLALADVDRDGDLDLFVGGRSVPGRYPAPAVSRLLLWQDGRWIEDPRNSLGRLGLVNGAVWSDLDGDGWADLALACEWGPIRVFRNQSGVLTEVTRPWGLEPWTGWWNGVAAGDFDGDGRMDLVASNWGLNHRYAPAGPVAFRVFHGDLNRDGSTRVFPALLEDGGRRRAPFEDLNVIARGLPFVRDRYRTYAAFADATVAEILGDRMAAATELRIGGWEHRVFLNRGGRFDSQPLPAAAQIAPAFGVCVADFDGDGREDVFLAQNFFPVAPEQHRLDAGLGCWLRGDGTGRFEAVPAATSGIRIEGDARGAAVADYDGDGRMDLAVGQNNGPTRLLRNRRAIPGLRVRLQGPPGNPSAIGAAMRVVTSEKTGPLRELHAGSGYGSQDSAVAVLARPAGEFRLHVRWPSGRVTETQIPVDAKEATLDMEGRCQVNR